MATDSISFMPSDSAACLRSDSSESTRRSRCRSSRLWMVWYGRFRCATDCRLFACGSVSAMMTLGMVPTNAVFPLLGLPEISSLSLSGKSEPPVRLNIGACEFNVRPFSVPVPAGPCLC
jgi:hypothetical protein